MLTWTIWISFLGAGLIMLLPAELKNLARWTALLVSLSGLLIALHFFFAYDVARGGFQFGNDAGVAWIPELGIQYKMGVDGISLPLVVLTGSCSSNRSEPTTCSNVSFAISVGACAVGVATTPSAELSKP